MQLTQAAIERYLTRLLATPIQVQQVQTLGGSTGATALKALGYGQPLRIDFVRDGIVEQVVLHQITRNGFGRERDADRVAEVWLNHATFNRLPRHVTALDRVALTAEGELEPAGQIQELLLLTRYAPGTVYAEDLIRIRDEGICHGCDQNRARALATYLAEIHAVRHVDPLLWRRRLRDLVGHGEGIMGLTDSYPTDFALATSADLRAIEAEANCWRWRLKPLTHRLAQVHGDFHPFNILFQDGVEFQLLDRSRGEWGEPADDVSCLAINYLFFSLQAFGALAGPFAQLYHIFWESYLAQRADPELLGVIQPWFAWRALVLANPLWYPTLSDPIRRKLLTFARRLLTTEAFQWQAVNQYWEE